MQASSCLNSEPVVTPLSAGSRLSASVRFPPPRHSGSLRAGPLNRHCFVLFVATIGICLALSQILVALGAVGLMTLKILRFAEELIGSRNPTERAD